MIYSQLFSILEFLYSYDIYNREQVPVVDIVVVL